MEKFNNDAACGQKTSKQFTFRDNWKWKKLDWIFWKTFEGTKLSKNETGTKSQPFPGVFCPWTKRWVILTLQKPSVNHFLDRLWRTISRFIAKFGHSQYGFIPTTYILPRDRRLLKENWKSNESYIMKPVASARGIGIKMVSKIDQIPKKRPVIIQNYIRNPLLINGLKWDLRIYVFVTSFSPLVAYIAGKLLKNGIFTDFGPEIGNFDGNQPILFWK